MRVQTGGKQQGRASSRQRRRLRGAGQQEGVEQQRPRPEPAADPSPPWMSALTRMQHCPERRSEFLNTSLATRSSFFWSSPCGGSTAQDM